VTANGESATANGESATVNGEGATANGESATVNGKIATVKYGVLDHQGYSESHIYGIGKRDFIVSPLYVTSRLYKMATGMHHCTMR